MMRQQIHTQNTKKRLTQPPLILALLILAGAYWMPAIAGLDKPITHAEAQLAEAIARESLPNQKTRQISTPGAINAARTETILITLKEQKAKNKNVQPSRIAEVFIYDYQHHFTEYRAIDLTSSSIVRSETLRQHHLPLNQSERETAMQVLFNDASALQQIEAELRSHSAHFATVGTVNPAEHVDIKVTIHEPHSSLEGPSRVCSELRCAELSLYTKSLISLNAEPVIDLSTGQIISMRIY